MKKAFLLLAATLSAFTFTFAQGWKFEVEHECIPTDFDPQKYTLLVMHLPNRNNPEKTSGYATNNLRKTLTKFYPYKFEIVTPKNLRDDSLKYADTSVYRFILLNSLNTTDRVDGGYTKNIRTGIIKMNSPERVKMTTVDFSFYDLSKEKQYPFLGAYHSSLWRTIKPLVKAVNEVSGRNKTPDK